LHRQTAACRSQIVTVTPHRHQHGNNHGALFKLPCRAGILASRHEALDHKTLTPGQETAYHFKWYQLERERFSLQQSSSGCQHISRTCTPSATFLDLARNQYFHPEQVHRLTVSHYRSLKMRNPQTCTQRVQGLPNVPPPSAALPPGQLAAALSAALAPGLLTAGSLLGTAPLRQCTTPQSARTARVQLCCFCSNNSGLSCI
jgi:hypothetical protein